MGKPIRNLSTVRRVGLDRAGSRSRREGRDRGGARLGRIPRMGDRYLRKLLVVGACATLRHRRGHSDALRLWVSGMLERKTVKYKFNLTAVAPPTRSRASSSC
jgi:transposase